MKNAVVLALSAIPTIGVISQWIAARFKLPSILLLLLSGFFVGPILGIINPDQLLGDIIYPFVSLSVALILFEGGLTLQVRDIQHTGNIIRNLISIGALVSWVGISIASYYIIGLSIELSLLLGAILIVSGPTVVTPLLRQIKLKHSLSSILRWEGITIDPIGATLAVLVFEVIIAQTTTDAIGSALVVIISTLLSGIIIGALSALFMIIIFKKRLIPDYLQEAFTFVMVLSTYAISDLIQSESGLLVVTVLGIILANQRIVTIRHIVSFKENITVLLLSSLFILLAARIELDHILSALNIQIFIFLAVLIFVVRPLSVFLSTFKSSLKFREKLFLSSLYPRGIVAAAVASLFSIRLQESGFENADLIVSITFFIIICTVAIYGLLGRPLVLLFSLQRNQEGVIFVGGELWVRKFAKVLSSSNIPVLIIDTNIENILLSKEEGLDTRHGSILSQQIMEEIEISNYGKLLAVTSSDETNLLSCIEYSTLLNSSHIWRLYPKDKQKDLFNKNQSSHFLFNKGITSNYINNVLTAGANFKLTAITKEFMFDDFKQEFPKAICLCMINAKGRLKFFSETQSLKPVPGCTLVTLRK
ncbi:hypothetical protein DID78_06305 [Candidatus Marinamargulisbacteria bacterium SCGC AG-343-D04]|nr:hypothetical protein DID78_06305 [Candidatus Marinamargulisbacteria bacterium SCGC AG-343-D04]